MDTLSQILQAIRARSPLIADVSLGADVSVGLPALGGLPFHYVLKGACRLDTESASVDLVAGDCVMLSRLPYYRVATGNGASRVEAMDFAEEDNFSVGGLSTSQNQVLRRHFGDAPIEARIFSAILVPGGRTGGPIPWDLPVIALLRDVKSLLEPWLVGAIDFMSAEVREFEPGLAAVGERLVEVIFIAVLRKWLLEVGHDRDWMRGLKDPTISRVLNAMHAEPGRRWTLQDLATASACSRSGMARHFKEVMGTAPFAYLTRWRMHLAALALASGRRSTAEIGESVGYLGSQTFARAFFNSFGETPAQYRRRCRAESARKPPKDGYVLPPPRR